ncbi:hypothetical protein AB0333_02425 [Citricoccus sp. NPDC079358]|uniref:hypothetical protein n=1 Tax=Citricoccus sp. NPDC079358 TaxID=3154653 RepID=UPI00344D1B04
MTTTAWRSTTEIIRPRADLRRFDRIVAAILMPIGPAAVAMLRFVIPGEPVAESVAADPSAQRLVLALGVVAVFTLLPGAYAAIHVLRRSAPRLTAWTAVLLIPGYLGMSALFGLDAFTMASYDAGMAPADTKLVADAMMALPTSTILMLAFLVGHIAGTVMLGTAALSARAIPLFIGILLVISQPLHLVAVMTSLRWLDLVAWGLTAVGMAALAWRVLHTTNEEWDLPPTPQTESRSRSRRHVARPG